MLCYCAPYIRRRTNLDAPHVVHEAWTVKERSCLSPRELGVTSRIATIGDQPSDVLMFARSGSGIAMGNASDQVSSSADATTDSCNDDGLAPAIERFIVRPSGPDVTKAMPWTP